MTVVVVGAAIVVAGRVLAAQRATPEELAGFWEFPGGKVEPGETDRVALVRECAEELGVSVEPELQIGGDWPLKGDYVLRVWLTRLRSGVPQAREHLALRWLGVEELYDVAWVAADLPVVRDLEKVLRNK